MGRWNGISRIVGVLMVLLSFGGTSIVFSESASSRGTRNRDPFVVTYHQENDGPWLNHIEQTDRYYTHGIALSVVHRPDWGFRFTEALPSGNTQTDVAIGYVFTHKMFTPQDLSISEVIQDDRPYAGLAYLGTALFLVTEYYRDHLQLNLGAVGPITGAGEIQTWSHAQWGGADPQGWPNQLANEPVIQLEFERVYQYIWHFTNNFGIQALPALKGSVGTASSELRVGLVSRIGLNVPEDFGPPPLGSPFHPSNTQAKASLYGFVGVAGSLVGHDILIQGNTIQTSHGVAIRHGVGEVQVGIGTAVPLRNWRFVAVYYQTAVSEQFAGQNGPHRFGSAMFSFVRY